MGCGNDDTWATLEDATAHFDDSVSSHFLVIAEDVGRVLA
jgi:hypothetical protein